MVKILESSIELLKANEIRFYTTGGVDDSTIDEAENSLGYTLPSDFRDVQKEYGAMSFLNVELYGVLCPSRNSVPDGLWYTLENRAYNLPGNIFLLGSGEYVAPGLILDGNQKGSVVDVSMSTYPLGLELQLISDSFLTYFVNRVEAAVAEKTRLM